MLTVYDSQSKSYVLTDQIGRGGEGTVFRSPHDFGTVAKIYHEPISEEKAEKLRWMAANQNEQLLKVAAWITDVLYDAHGGKIVGFLMPSVEAKEIHELYSLKSRRVHFPRATWQFLIHAATNVARAFYGLHKSGHIMGDVNHGNCVVLANGTVKLIDCDSYSISDGARCYSCEVGVATHLAPELQGKNLADVERIAAHDNFGLAVIIFQLLFLGRHPFAGTYEGDVDKSLEDCIRELRFAYARDAHLWKIRRPPGTLSLDAVSARVGLMFERAFLTEDRPEPREWIEALEDLSKSLKQCSLHPGHHFFQELAACPFCEIETKAGLMLFPFIGAQKDNENFNIFTVENLVASFGTPQTLPALSKNRLALPPSPEIEAQQRNNWVLLVMFSAGQFIVLLVSMFIFGIGGAFVIAILVTSVLIALQNQSRNISRGSLTFELESAQHELKQLEEEWTSGGSAQYVKSLTQIRMKIADYKKIQVQGGQKLKFLREAIFRYRLDLYLSSFKIADSKIPGIGESRLNTLKMSGINSAADVDANRLLSLEAIGEATTAKLFEWRKNLEKDFQFNAEEIPEAELKRFSTEFTERRRGIEREIELLLGTLRSGSLVVRKNQEHLRAKIENASQRLWQIESDLKTIGSGAAATVTLIAVSFSTLVIGSLAESSAPPARTKVPRGYIQDSEPPPARANGYGSGIGSGSGYRLSQQDVQSNYDVPEADYTVAPSITDDEIAEMSDFERQAASKTLHREALELAKEKNYKKAEKKLRFALRFLRYDKAVLNELGYVLYEQKRYSESLDFLFESLNNIDPSNVGTKTYIGLNYLAMKDFEKARDRFTEVTQQVPYSFDGNYNLGLAYKGLKNYYGAVESFRQASTLSPEDADSNYQIALCLKELNDTEGVRNQYEILLYKDRLMAEKLKREVRIR